MTERRMNAYYYSFDSTGCDPVDKILSAVACAGKAYHHTNDWNEHASPRDDHTGETPIDWIQNAAIEAADEIERLRAKRDAAYKIGGEEALLFALHPEFGSIYDTDGEATAAHKAGRLEGIEAAAKEAKALTDAWRNPQQRHGVAFGEAITATLTALLEGS